ncbi:MAG: hypothetical protein EB060_07025 [Proteobacteria bacterium]|nr:hypothetical protein [Pseudomonadota bacterium]
MRNFSALLLVLLIALPAYGADRVVDTECVEHCERKGYSTGECYEQCPKFDFSGTNRRETERYNAFRACVSQCLQNNPYQHYYACAIQVCRMKE